MKRTTPHTFDKAKVAAGVEAVTFYRHRVRGVRFLRFAFEAMVQMTTATITIVALLFLTGYGPVVAAEFSAESAQPSAAEQPRSGDPAQPEEAERPIYGLMAREAWAAFYCSALVSFVTEDSEEVGRLIRFGNERGRAFYDGYLSGEITEDDTEGAPVVALEYLRLGGTIDFMLGRLYESAKNDAYSAIYQGTDSSSEDFRGSALRDYSTRNCEIIGR